MSRVQIIVGVIYQKKQLQSTSIQYLCPTRVAPERSVEVYVSCAPFPISLGSWVQLVG
jgi:hypothetical protein